MGLTGIDTHDAIAFEDISADPVRVQQQEIMRNFGDGRLEVQAAGEVDGYYFVVERSQCGGELFRREAVGARRQTDIYAVTGDEYIATIERCGTYDVN